MTTNYPESRRQLRTSMARQHSRLPGVLNLFGQLHEEALKTGALDGRQKELIALGISIAVRCDGCIASHVGQALSLGASPHEIAETVGVAILMGGGPSVVYGMQALEAVDQFRLEEFGAGETRAQEEPVSISS